MCFPSMVKVQSSYSLKASFSCTLSLGTRPHGSRQIHSLYYHGKNNHNLYGYLSTQQFWYMLVHEVWHACIWMTLDLPLSSCIFPCINFTPLTIPFNNFAPFLLQMLISTEHVCTNTYWSHGNFSRLYQSICSFVLALSSASECNSWRPLETVIAFRGPNQPINFKMSMKLQHSSKIDASLLGL